ncbi:HD domain-containing protein [Granulicella sp. dw_53]|uniref:HD domain-containing protein n=1 Tax=Granulicella sp. dw_53 TaxID=2719792 RepID=UPI001BD669EE|nr:HD domain-containing protein [Granulicella sp. dw_53]
MSTVSLACGAGLEATNIPDSQLAQQVTEFIRDPESEFLFNHSSRVYSFAALAGYLRGLKFDCELLYSAAMCHDIGLVPAHSSAAERFEVDGANAARDFLRQRGIVASEIDHVWTAIALHTTPGIPQHMHPVVALVTAGVEMDVLGIGYGDVEEDTRKAYRRPVSAHATLQGRHSAGLLRRNQTQA